MIENKIEINSYSIINTNISLWTGKAKLKAEDLPEHVVRDMPPAELISLGSKSLIDPKLLSPMATIKTAVHRFMTLWGVKFLGGFMIDVSHIDYVNRELRKFQKQFEGKVSQLELAYDTATQEWCDQHPEWAAMIREALPTAQAIASKFKFDWCVYTINPQDINTEEQIKHVADAGISEMAELIADVCERSFPAGRTSPITKRTLGALDSIAEKAKHLSFLHPHFARIERVIADLEGCTDPAKIRLMLKSMSDPVELENFCQQMSTSGVTQAFEDVMAALSAPIAVATESEPVVIATQPCHVPAPEPNPAEQEPAPQPQLQGLQFSPDFMAQFGGLL